MQGAGFSTSPCDVGLHHSVIAGGPLEQKGNLTEKSERSRRPRLLLLSGRSWHLHRVSFFQASSILFCGYFGGVRREAAGKMLQDETGTWAVKAGQDYA